MNKIKKIISVFRAAFKSQSAYAKESRQQVFEYDRLVNKAPVARMNGSFWIRLYRGSRFSIPSENKRHFTYKLTYDDGITLFSPIENHLFHRADLEYTGKVISLFGKLGVKRILDLGANIGTFSLPLAIRFPDIKFYCVEINWDNISAIRKSIKYNRLNNLDVISRACWSDANSEIEIAHTNSVSSSVVQSGVSGYDAASFPSYKVQTIDLRTLVETYGQFDIIKIDIEGSEYEVFKNAYHILKNVKILICELHLVKNTLPEETELFKNIVAGFEILERVDYLDKTRIELVCINKNIN